MPLEGCFSFDSWLYFAITILLLWCLFIYVKKHRKEFFKTTKFILIPPVFLCGFVIYLVGYYDGGTKEQLVTLVFRSALSSVRMFFSFSDIQELREVMKDNQYFMLLLSMTNLVALMTSFVVALQLMGNKLYFWLKYHFIKPDTCYIFFDINDASIALAKNIFKKKKSDSGKKKDIILFLKNKTVANVGSQSKDMDTESLSNDFLFNVGAITVESEYTNQSSLEDIGIARLLNISHHSHLFFLSNEENKNIQLAVNIADRIHQKGYGEHSRGKKPYQMHVLYTSEQNEKYFLKFSDRKDKDNNSKYPKVDFHFFNQSELSALRLIKIYPPVNYIKIDTNKGVALEDFNVLILGFGEIGQYSLRYLIEQGQFVGSTFHAVVIDKKINEVKGLFKERYPALESNYAIEYKTMKCDEEYFHFISGLLPTLRYIVVAYGDDGLNISTAMEISDMIRKRSLEVPVLVNIKNDENLFKTGVLGEIFERKHDGSIGIRSKNDKLQIGLFGMNKYIFSYDNIVNEDIIQKARQVNKIYNGDKDDWEELNAIKKISNISVAIHLQTKLKLMGITKEKVKNYPNKEAFSQSLDNEKKTNLAITEHLRWNATYFVHGWQVQPKGLGKDRDYDTERHICLVPWEELPNIGKQYQGYDVDNIEGVYDLCTK